MSAKRKKRGGLSQVADIGDVQEFAARIKPSWVVCRSDGHNMRPFNVTMDENGNFLRTKRCTNCGYKRHYVISQGGHIAGAKAEYPEDYLMPKGTGRLDSEGRAVFRQRATEAEYRRKAQRG
jgi:hypothetical protein